MIFEHVGEILDRALFVLDVPQFEPFQVPSSLPTDHFLCLLAADFTAASDGDIAGLANSLLECGASYFVCWGPGCERAHDLIDDVTLLFASPVSDDSVIMSTWHPDQPLYEALFFLLCNAWPDIAYEETTGCIVAVSIGGGVVASEIRQALSQPEAFIAKMSA